ncbi:hypothetical protein EVAR_39774_1 [Eumeta japonica]|uniref:Uncharacterized protein n=1 Tax=Eumeta variegata TaxID=151549 RepID=A0A4C1X2U7_EUMVA|nr:hypothetical protein EVAR_39774_1 [Eumeta japonica]
MPPRTRRNNVRHTPVTRRRAPLGLLGFKDRGPRARAAASGPAVQWIRLRLCKRKKTTTCTTSYSGALNKSNRCEDNRRVQECARNNTLCNSRRNRRPAPRSRRRPGALGSRPTLNKSCPGRAAGGGGRPASAALN